MRRINPWKRLQSEKQRKNWVSRRIRSRSSEDLTRLLHRWVRLSMPSSASPMSERRAPPKPEGGGKGNYPARLVLYGT
jgi:hypothetical protein